jgi:hypothetical protein
MLAPLAADRVVANLGTDARDNWIAGNKLLREEAPPFGDPEHVLHYLARYTHRVAISNHRLLSVNESEVRFRWRDYKNHNKKRTMTLTWRRVSPPLSSARASQGFPAHSLFRMASQPKAWTSTAALPRSPESATRNSADASRASTRRFRMSEVSRTDARLRNVHC